MKGYITLQDYKGNQATCSVSYIEGLPQIVDLANYLKNLTHAQVVSASVILSEDLDDTASSDGRFPFVEEKAHLTFRDLDRTDNQTTIMQIPAPVDHLLVEDSKGWRVDDLQGQGLAAVLARDTSHDIRFVKGHHRAKKRKRA